MKHPIVKTNATGKVVTTSRDVAAYFGKEHARVLRDIKELDCSKEFIDGNFAVNEYKDSIGRTLPMYEMTRDGFTTLTLL